MRGGSSECGMQGFVGKEEEGERVWLRGVSTC